MTLWDKFYFTSSDSVDGQFILICISETVKLFQFHGLRTSLLVCDGSLANLATITLTHGHVDAHTMFALDFLALLGICICHLMNKDPWSP